MYDLIIGWIVDVQYLWLCMLYQAISGNPSLSLIHPSNQSWILKSFSAAHCHCQKKHESKWQWWVGKHPLTKWQWSFCGDANVFPCQFDLKIIIMWAAFKICPLKASAVESLGFKDPAQVFRIVNRPRFMLPCIIIPSIYHHESSTLTNSNSNTAI